MNENVESEINDVSNSDMEAAFAASFDEDTKQDQPKTEPHAVVEVENVQEVEKVVTPQAPLPTLSEDQIKLLSAIPELERRLTQQVDKVSGNYGEMKRLLDSMQKAAATQQGAAAFESSGDADAFDAEFPEIARGIQSKIARVVSQIPTGLTESQFESMYIARRQREDMEKRNELIQVLESAHPDRFEIQQTPEWGTWLDGLLPHQKQSLMNSEDPYYVSGMLGKFKAYRETKALTEKKNKQRVEGAVTPTGVRPAMQSTISEEEAAQRAFEDQFK